MSKLSNTATANITKLQKISIFGIFLISILPSRVYAYSEVSGIQAGIWSLEKSPYIVKGNILIPKGLVLKIEEGVIIKFAGSYQITVEGGLIANGGKAKPIVFTSIFDNEFGKTKLERRKIPQPSEWNGIEFLNDCDDYLTILNYCVIRYSKWCIRCSNTFPLITNIRFVDNYASSLKINNQEVLFEPGQRINLITRENRPVIDPLPIPTPIQETDSEKARRLLFEQQQEMQHERMRIIQDSTRKAQKIKPVDSKIGWIFLDRELFDQRNPQSMPELFSYLPGFWSVSTIWRGTQILSRGISPNLPDNRFLFLINGFPFYEPLAKTSFLELVPLDAIEHIEINRGISPSPFNLHGITGSANFIPRYSNLRQVSEYKIQWGDFGTKQLTAFLGVNQDSTFLNLSTKFMNIAGFWRTLAQEAGGRSSRQKYADDLYHFSALLKRGSLSGFTGYIEQDSRQPGLIPSIQPSGLTHQNSFVFALSKEMTISRQFKMKIIGNYAHSYERLDIGNPRSEDSTELSEENYLLSKGDLISMAIISQYQTPVYLLATGATVSRSKMGPLFAIKNENGPILVNEWGNQSEKTSEYEGCSFVEIGYNVSPFIGLVGKTYLNFVPSLETPIFSVDTKIIYNPFLPLASYWRYTQTGRSATILEKEIYLPDFYYGNSKLKAEKFEQWEWATDIHPTRNWTIGLMIYHLRNRNLIQLNSAYQFVNNDHRFQTTGCECLLQGKIKNRFFLLSNVLFQHQKLSGWVYPQLIANGLISISWSYNFSTTTLFKYSSEIKCAANLGPYYLVHLIFTYQLLPNIKLSISGFDLFDQRPENPDYIRGIIPAMPAGAGRSFYITVAIE